MRGDRSTHPANAHFELRFQSLYKEGYGMAFPCDQDGRIDIDAMGERARSNYFFARAMIGHDFAMPAVISRAA
jgi:hypothetical protein